MRRTLLLSLVMLVASCGGGDPTGTGAALHDDAGFARASIASSASCPACIVELAVVRTAGPPNTEVRRFAADPSRRYRITVHLPRRGSLVWVRLNGRTLVSPGRMAAEGRPVVFDDRELRSSNTLTVRIAGVPGRKVRVRIERLGSDLAACSPWTGAPEPLFASWLAPLDQLVAIQPLGSLSPPGHTLPVHHVYLNSPTLIDSGGRPVATGVVELRAPAPMHVVALQVSEAGDDFKVILRPCLEVAMYLDHVRQLSPALQAAYETARRYDLPGARIALLDLPLAAGDAIGVAGDARFDADGHSPSALGPDLGLIDLRRPPNPFVNPARYDFPDDASGFFPPGIPPEDVALIVRDVPPRRLQQFCPLDYFAAPVRDGYRALLGDYSGATRRTMAPVCGDSMQDLAGTLQGGWFEDKPANGIGPEFSNAIDEERLLAFAPDHVDPSRLVLSIGLGVEQPAGSPSAWSLPVGTYLFGPPLPSGHVNRAFAEVVPGATYCYQGLFPRGGGPTPLPGIVLVEVSSTELWIQYEAGAASCPAVLPRLSASPLARRYVR